MTGRGIDQIQRFPSDPELHEPYVHSAADYVALAESLNGPIPRSIAPEYIWGDALDIFRQMQPDARIVNLETSITTSGRWEAKGVNYRMHPKNVPCLTVAGIDCCNLANNHVLDWGPAGLLETLQALHAAGIRTVGAGLDRASAEAPALLTIPGKGRLLVYGFGHPSSGIPPEWAAGTGKPGVSYLDRLTPQAVAALAERVSAAKGRNDIAIASIHWGSNWGWEIPENQRRFARALIDDAGFDVVHGHSSHHIRAFEVHRGKPIFYGCGDLLTDYEGIAGYEEFRGDLALMYFLAIDPASGKLLALDMIPVRMRRFRLGRAPAGDVRWVESLLNREGKAFGVRVGLRGENRLVWQGGAPASP